MSFNRENIRELYKIKKLNKENRKEYIKEMYSKDKKKYETIYFMASPILRDELKKITGTK